MNSLGKKLETPDDFADQINDVQVDNREIYRQAIIAFSAPELASFIREAKRKAGVHFGYSGDTFFDVLKKCLGTEEGAFVTEKKISDLCALLSDDKENETLIANIVDVMRNRRETTEVRHIQRQSDDVRAEMMEALIRPEDRPGAKAIERSLKRIYEEREKRAAELKFDLRRESEFRAPAKIQILNAFLRMSTNELQALDEVANRNGGSIFKIAMGIESPEDLVTIQAFTQGKPQDPNWKHAKAAIEQLCL